VFPFHLLVAMLCGWLPREQQDVMAFLREENRVLKTRLDGRRLRLDDHERRRLGELGHRLGRRVLADIVTIMTPETILRSVASMETPLGGASLGRAKVTVRIDRAACDALPCRPSRRRSRRASGRGAGPSKRFVELDKLSPATLRSGQGCRDCENHEQNVQRAEAALMVRREILPYRIASGREFPSKKTGDSF
jgi:hypothetical protein